MLSQSDCFVGRNYTSDKSGETGPVQRRTDADERDAGVKDGMTADVHEPEQYGFVRRNDFVAWCQQARIFESRGQCELLSNRLAESDAVAVWRLNGELAHAPRLRGGFRDHLGAAPGDFSVK